MDLRTLLPSIRDDARQLQRRLDDPLLPRGKDAAIDIDFARSADARMGDARWRLQAGAAAAVHLFVDAADSDPERIFGAARKGESTVQRPLLHPAVGSAWVKYVLRGTASVDAGAKQAMAGAVAASLSGSAEGSAAAGAYLQAPVRGTLQQAIEDHVAAFPWIFDAESVRGMRVGDACFVAMGGTFTAALQLDWSSILAGDVRVLSALSVHGERLQLAVDAELGVSLRFAMEDSFRLLFVRTGAHHVRAVLHRDDRGSFRLRADAAATLRLEQPDVARRMLAQASAGLLGPVHNPLREMVAALEDALAGYDAALHAVHDALGDAATQLDAWFDTRGLSRVLERLRALQELAADTGQVAPVLAQRLELPLAAAERLLQQLDALPAQMATRLQDRLDAILQPLALPPLLQQSRDAAAGLLQRLDRIEAALLELADTRIKAAIGLDYERLATGAALLDVDLDLRSPEFSGRHADLLALRLDRVLVDSTRDGAGVALRLFLHQQRLRRRFSLGLALGSELVDMARSGNEWVLVDRRALDEDGQQQRQQSATFNGYRAHEERLFGSAASCRGDLDARLKQTDGAAARWRFALALEFGSRTARAGRAWLHAAADFGALWGIVAEDQAADLAQRLADTGAIGSAVDLELSLAFGNAAFDRTAFLDAWASPREEDIAGALAAALPVVGNVPERQSPAARRAAYGRALHALTGRAGVDLGRRDAIARHVATHLATSSPALRTFEARRHPQFLGSVAQVATHPKAGGRIDGMLREFVQAGTLLRRAAAAASNGGAQDRKRIADAAHGLDLGWINRFVLRWQGALLLQLARETGVASRAVRPRLVLTVDLDGAAVRHIFAGDWRSPGTASSPA